jgi:hypothetical protein
MLQILVGMVVLGKILKTMKRIGIKEVLTTKHCPCCKTTLISEVLTLIIGKETPYAKEHLPDTPMIWLESYISCRKCSIQYGKPGFVSITTTMTDYERDFLKWELSLFEATLKRKLNPADFFITENDKIPVELSTLKTGDIVFIDESHVLDKEIVGHRSVRLFKRKNTPVYHIRSECFE